MAQRKELLIAVLLACVPAALTLGLESGFPQPLERFGGALLFPGIMGAMAVSGNAHAFHLWVAAIWNFVFYFLICWAMIVLIGIVAHRIGASQRAGKP